MQVTMAQATSSTNQSFLQTLGELGFLDEIHPTSSLSKQACKLAIQASALTFLTASVLAFLLWHAPHSQNQQLLFQQCAVAFVLVIADIALSLKAFGAITLNNNFADSVCQLIASDVVAGQEFTALVTVKPKRSTIARSIELELVGSKVFHEMDTSGSKGSGGIWTTDRKVADETIVAARNVTLAAGEDFKVEEVLKIPIPSSMQFERKAPVNSYPEHQWKLVLRLRFASGPDYVCRFPLYVNPQI